MLNNNDGTNNFQTEEVEERTNFQNYQKPKSKIFGTIIGIVILILVAVVMFINNGDIESKTLNSLKSVTWDASHVQKLDNIKLNVTDDDGVKTTYDSEDLALYFYDIAYYAENATELSYEFNKDSLKKSVSYYLVGEDYVDGADYVSEDGPIVLLLEFNSSNDAIGAQATIQKYYDTYPDEDKKNLPTLFVIKNNLIISNYTITPDNGVEADGAITLKKDLNNFMKNIFVPKFLK